MELQVCLEVLEIRAYEVREERMDDQAKWVIVDLSERRDLWDHRAPWDLLVMMGHLEMMEYRETEDLKESVD